MFAAAARGQRALPDDIEPHFAVGEFGLIAFDAYSVAQLWRRHWCARVYANVQYNDTTYGQSSCGAVGNWKCLRH